MTCDSPAQMEINMAYMYEQVGNTSASEQFLSRADSRRTAMNAVFYDATEGTQ